MEKNKYQKGMDKALAAARKCSDGDPTMAITVLMAAAIFLQHQIGLPKRKFLMGASLQWDEIGDFLALDTDVSDSLREEYH